MMPAERKDHPDRKELEDCEMKYLHELCSDSGIKDVAALSGCPVNLNGPNRVNILALGDVGTTMLIGLRLLGADVISEIGIMDIRQENLERLEMEINQAGYPFGYQKLPEIRITEERNLFDCDLLIFCASRGVPPVDASANVTDVRMIQLEANREIIRHYAEAARRSSYRGMVAVVSDPVDNLAAAFLDAAELEPWQLQGYGLGVMNMRALYYAQQHKEGPMSLYAEEGRAYGPHGQDLVIANSIEHYDGEVSEALTKLAVESNLRIRELGYKPYIAPAISSAALSILLTLRGEWHYGSVYMGSRKEGAFLGVKNRLTEHGIEYEDIPLPDALYERILKSYSNLCRIR